MEITPFANAGSTDLRVDAIYRGDRNGNSSDDPLPLLLKVSNSGGFRYRGQIDSIELVALTTSKKDPDWPDMLDRETGIYTYYGDNKEPGRSLHETPRKGNELLRRIFELAHSGMEGRQRVPPIFLFENLGEYRDVVFLGLAVPGGTDLRASEDLVAIWRISNGSRFQNYRARFSVLNTPSVSRSWLVDIFARNPHSQNAPAAWSDWIRTGTTKKLTATKSLEYRTKIDQIPESPIGRSILEKLREHFQDDFHVFEQCAAELAKILLPHITEIDVTRPSRDGGRDAVGKLRIGSETSGVLVDFALEAKCYSPSVGVGVRDMSRLISRLRHRQFGILVTTSYVNVQAYKEIKEDQHPIIVISGADIVGLLREEGCTHPSMVGTWLESASVL